MEHSKPSSRRAHHWRRDAVELAAVFLSVTAADLVAKIVARGPDGPAVLAASAVALVAVALLHTWWSPHAPPPTTLWRVRAAPLAHTHAALADHEITLLSLHPGTGELFLRTPRSLSPGALAGLLTATGHTLADSPTRIA
ncbi:hypothetical protein [Streptomyces rubellomurinus]|uniref:Uncharacterized protein n=2 Tax=Streptomyces TaxID=1883 RepID=A0A0F2THB0_STRR3|nr:hypothetical protein [Streptomyces rubellomurinus]KJS52551.1 hypothetical protein VM98_30665 [Streptomyces rubellomurinus subsp. indigoferus]KJS62613.1 hypothetical protein VM95_07365 [Streptomyces rubellomurinus]